MMYNVKKRRMVFMKYITKLWKREHDGILYFFQRLEEMLFHYSSDIVRVPVNNTRTLLNEYISNYNDSQVKEYQLSIILEEICESIKTNKILITRFGEDFIYDIERSIRKTKYNAVHYLHNKLSNKSYYNWCIEYIKQHATQANHKDEIEFGLRSWIVELISRGYSPEYIYSYLHSEINNTSNNTPFEILQNFLEHFSLTENKYRVYFSFSPQLAEYKDLLEKRLHISFYDKNISDLKIYKKDFVGYLDLESLDKYSAMARAFRKINLFILYYRVISNNRNELIRKYGFVKTLSKDDLEKVPIKSLGYHSIESSTKENRKDTIDQVILGCQNKPVAFQQLNKMIDLHNEGISQRSLNNGFLNLWSIMEIVSEHIPCDSKIDKITSGILPILQKDYFPSVFYNINQDLTDNLSPNDYLELMQELKSTHTSEDTIETIIAKFILLPEYEELRETFFKKLERFPIIRTKIYRLYALKDNKSQLIHLAKNYTQRVKWHMYRLYRTRNSIVHSGKSHYRIQALGEHLHIYVDLILNELLSKLSSEHTLHTVSDVLSDAKLMSDKILYTFDNNSPTNHSDILILCQDYYFRSNR